MVSKVLLPGTTVAFEKEAIAPFGRPDCMSKSIFSVKPDKPVVYVLNRV